MIVYGDPSACVPAAEGLRQLRNEWTTIRGETSLDRLRALLIRTGQFEQGMRDRFPEASPDRFQATTDLVAQAFLARWQGFESDWDALGSAFDGLPAADEPLVVKEPEGFAFYGLYPEAYAVSARRWSQEHAPQGPVLVIGVRSIGTTLSAVVAESLRAEGTTVRRLTVRPTGHPFARKVDLAAEGLDGQGWALVVDEGPGLSGSSMASVGDALVRAGYPRERIAFFPGHGGEPGVQASESVRAWWQTTPRYWTPTEALRWDGRSLEETLAALTGGDFQIEDLTGGRWRESVYPDESAWPGVVAAFERRKLRVVRPDGSAWLWKFAGLSVPESTLGFVGTPWIDGEPLRREDATPEILREVGRHLLAAAGSPLNAGEAKAAGERLAEMLRVNAAEAGIEALLPSFPAREELPSAGDYRLAPAEWRRLPDGRLAKAGRIAPTLDHTVVGRQPLAWDVAGALVEWGWEDPTDLPPVPSDLLTFYRAAYAAFRMGQCAMFQGEDAEGRRLARDAAFYRKTLERVLAHL